MFRCEPSRYMSKARYLIAMRRVFGFNIAGTEESGTDKSTAFLLERCYHSFDAHNRCHPLLLLTILSLIFYLSVTRLLYCSLCCLLSPPPDSYYMPLLNIKTTHISNIHIK
jgi:hypothetical protein